MKNNTAVMMTVSLALVSSSCVWAQGNPGASPGTAAEHPDEIVRMHQQVAAADREYNREVAAAKKVYDHKKAEAKKKRDAAVQIAHSGAGQ
ncbi:hypothetical protein R69927_00736 [Paraburkholderia domus]|jgi:hypothetical protein|uniref:Lipoprotein n=1 Tax=Paraburkholderia domus TaxID=2793075 RepID=A0A9N8QXB1_9BURK|nr:hypothetical protein [Paraburkholderia domus]MBK5050958.1 hypothetical protein [Burkholderia sp. R-70006]MBK5060272.1 hypothetical protein [Burkholderia sp. R-70199]MBK5085099.1 hypothetical protein [Burkholderia sp. R-69927]MBK5118535.1 hypothetical protein [Burkholderia sp. R-69980]MBK5164373.1 hypothetical protein [Burkholderia sp. R-70211]MBK5184469.1 hypothetical protein [Burkholderia sp. R-69749]